MKNQSSLSLLTLAATSALAQSQQSGPFTLTIVDSSNATLNGQSLYACHAGAAEEGLCNGPAGPAGVSSTYYFNYTLSEAETSPSSGALVWNLPVNINDTVQNVSSPMSFTYNPTSNVAVPLFQPSYATTSVGFDKDNKMFVYGYGDDSKDTPGNQPVISSPEEAYNWQICYTMVGGYYYQALAWVTSGQPHNPTCQSVNVTRTFL